MGKHIVIIDGHPDRRPERYVHALARAYREGAKEAGHEIWDIGVAKLVFPLLRKREDFEASIPPAVIRRSQGAIKRADHLLILYPLRLGSMPAALKAFFEQTFRPGFGFAAGGRNRMPKRLLKGKSARIVVTMGMPAFFYRWYYRAHSLKSLERNILSFCGVGPVRASVVGLVEGMSRARRKHWLMRMNALGRSAT